jgi:hypothetical protein
MYGRIQGNHTYVPQHDMLYSFCTLSTVCCTITYLTGWLHSATNFVTVALLHTFFGHHATYHTWWHAILHQPTTMWAAYAAGVSTACHLSVARRWFCLSIVAMSDVVLGCQALSCKQSQ